MKNFMAAFVCVVLLSACSKKELASVDKVLSSQKELRSFSLVVGKDTVKMNIMDSTIEGLRLDTSRIDSTVALFEFTGAKVQIEGVEQISGQTKQNIRDTLFYAVQAEDGTTKVYRLKLRIFTGLPIINITSPAITSKDTYVDGIMTINGNIDYPDAVYKIQIKGRGNSTWGNPKNPYKIKLSEKSSVLGMPADKEWALLANWYDKSLLRNDIAFELSERLQMAWTPRRKFVEVFFDGKYNGNYLLTETVKAAQDRLNIKTMNTKDANDTASGYILEADWRLEGPQTIITKWGVRFSLKEPELVSVNQLDYITRQMLKIEGNINVNNDLSSMIDEESWIKWTIVNELMRNRDATLFGSVYFYQGAAQKIFMGPVWDFDLSSGGYEGNVTDGWYVTRSNIVGDAFQYNVQYRAKFIEIWQRYKVQIDGILSYLDNQESILNNSVQQNYQRWDVMSSVLYEEQVIHSTYAEEIKYLRNWLSKRIKWIDNELNHVPQG